MNRRKHVRMNTSVDEDNAKLDKVALKGLDHTVVRKSGFRLSSKSCFLTYPRCSLSKERALELLKELQTYIYCCVSKEKHNDLNETPHLHALVQYERKVDTTNSRHFDLSSPDTDHGCVFHGNYQGAKDSMDVRTYIQKSGDFIEEGTFFRNNQSPSQIRSAKNKILLKKPLNELVDDGTISLYSYQQLSAAVAHYRLDSIKVNAYQPKTCYWICGKTGIGKSRWVRDNFPDQFYNKPMNKWWDGYQGELAVLIDDFDLQGQMLGHYLKIWSDCYSFNAEIKGNTIVPAITHFIVTSQYLPKAIWCQGNEPSKWDDEMREAIHRRFEMKTISADGVTLSDY